MMKSARENPLIVILIGLAFGYFIYYACATILWQYVIHLDINANPKYAFDDDEYWDLTTIISIGACTYFVNIIHSTCLSMIFTRHFGGINLVVHQLVFMYIYTSCEYAKNDCKKREWLSCYKNETMISNNETVILNDDGLNEASTLSIYCILYITVLILVLNIWSHLKNRKKLHYFSEHDSCYEFSSVLVLQYTAGIIYALIPLTIWIIFMCGINNDNNNNNECCPEDPMTVYWIFNGKDNTPIQNGTSQTYEDKKDAESIQELEV